MVIFIVTDFGVNLFLNKNILKLQNSQTRLIRTLLIHHFCLIRRGNLKTSKVLSLTPMLNQPFNWSPLLVRRKIAAYFTDESSGSDCKWHSRLVQHLFSIYISCNRTTY